MSFDINYIINGKKNAKKSKPIGIIGDRVTKQQRHAIKKDPWGNWDKDHVINGLDCAPRNKKKHMAYTPNYDRKPEECAYCKRMNVSRTHVHNGMFCSPECARMYYQEKNEYLNNLKKEN